MHPHGSAESQQWELIQNHKSDSKEAPVHTCAVSLIFECMLYDNVQVIEGIPSTLFLYTVHEHAGGMHLAGTYDLQI
mgnify:CR=1 FL=1